MALLTIPEAARQSGRPESHIRRAIRTGKLKARHFGAAWAIQERDLAAYLKQGGPAEEREAGTEDDWGA